MDLQEKSSASGTLARRDPHEFTEQLIEPFSHLRQEVDRLFDGLPFRLPTLRLSRPGALSLNIEMTESTDGFRIAAELPGIESGDVEITCEDNVLRIAGEKKEERNDSERGYRLSERSYGSFERLIALPSSADPDRIEASAKNGVLTIQIAKHPMRSAAKIPIKTAD